jgi:hypothetical protein
MKGQGGGGGGRRVSRATQSSGEEASSPKRCSVINNDRAYRAYRFTFRRGTEMRRASARYLTRDVRGADQLV